jgi:hypothetical protein
MRACLLLAGDCIVAAQLGKEDTCPVRYTAQKIAAHGYRWRPLNAWNAPPKAICVALTILISGSVLYLSAN